MRLGLHLGYWSPSAAGAGFADELALAREADRCGYAVVWAAEAYGADAPTVLATVAAATTRVDVGSAVMQIPARTATTTAMTAATLDALSGGRFRLGLGVSGPQVSEGWHGVAFDDPLGRTREYVEVVRLALGHRPVEHSGRHVTLPLPGGLGKPLRLALRPVRDRPPVYLAALGPRNLELTGEVADGWLGYVFGPEQADAVRERLLAGRRRAGRDDLDGFDLAPTVPVVLGDDVEACAAPVRAWAALYVGGMGARSANFYADVARRLGFADAVDRVQDHYLAGRHREAAAAVPLDLVDAVALVGPPARVARRAAAYADAGTTTLSIACLAPDPAERRRTVAAMAEIVRPLDPTTVAGS